MTDAASWWLRHCWHVTASHGIRVPLCWVRLLGRTPFGLARLLGVWWRWGTDPEGRQMRSAMNTAGVRYGRLHDARHTAATVLLLLGVPERTVMGVMGWSTTGIAARQHVTDPIRRKVAGLVDRLIWAPEEGD